MDLLPTSENPASVLVGDALATLRRLSAGCVNCVATSPPFYGLRDYGTARWEGGDPECEHEGDERWYTEQTAAVSSAGAFSEPGKANSDRLKKGRWRQKGRCVKCGAIHADAQLGLEKSLDEYVSRLVEIFREVRRVLHPSGVVWLNLGPSYASGGSKHPRQKKRVGVGRDIESVLIGHAERAAGGVVDSDADHAFVLRDDLSAGEVAYVLAELAAVARGSAEVDGPMLTV